MRISFAATLAAPVLAGLVLATPARAQISNDDVARVKQYMVCEGTLSKACELFMKGAFAEARAAFRAAADAGEAGALNNLGVLHENGAGVPRNAVRAVEWYRKAAEGGVAAAQYNLAMLTAGDHIFGGADPLRRDEDMAAAYMWLSLSADQKFALAVETLEELGRFLTKPQMAAAQKRLRARRGK